MAAAAAESNWKATATASFGEESVKVAEKLMMQAAPTAELTALRSQGGGMNLAIADKMIPESATSVVVAAHSMLRKKADVKADNLRIFEANARTMLKVMHQVGAVTAHTKGASAMVVTTTTQLSSKLDRAGVTAQQRAAVRMGLFSEEDMEAAKSIWKVVLSAGSSGSAAAAAVAAMLQTSAGNHAVERMSKSTSLGAAMEVVSFWIWDDIWDWIAGAVEWVKQAASEFGKMAAQLANALIDSVFNQYPSLTSTLAGIPFIGLLVAGMYAMAGKYPEQALTYFSLALTSTLSCIAGIVGFAVGGPAGGMIGAALGEFVGILIQKYLAQFVHDQALHSQLDISALQFIIEVAFAGAAGGAGGIGKVFAKELGYNAFIAFCTSQTLAGILAKLPAYITRKAAEGNKQIKGSSDHIGAVNLVPVDKIHNKMQA